MRGENKIRSAKIIDLARDLSTQHISHDDSSSIDGEVPPALACGVIHFASGSFFMSHSSPSSSREPVLIAAIVQ